MKYGDHNTVSIDHMIRWKIKSYFTTTMTTKTNALSLQRALTKP